LGNRALTPIFGYHASHEQHAPSALLDYVRAAEKAGFEGAMCSDHFHPWLEENGHSGYAWSWLGSALQASGLSFGTVCAPGYRYHPAIVAQAAATLAEMYPERLWVALGSGEAANEAITGARWPMKAERNARLRECAQVMRALWRGETVTHYGRVIVEEAKLYTRAKIAPLLFAAALSEETAEFAGEWADGLITTGGPVEQPAKLAAAFRRGGGEGKPVRVQYALSWDVNEEAARRGAHAQWRFSVLGSDVLADLRTPKQFAAAAQFVTPDDVAAKVRISSDPRRHVAWLREYLNAGFDAVYLFNVNTNQREYIRTFGEQVLPELKA
jgi:probable non-F420 flavinoid oxidoreductase